MKDMRSIGNKSIFGEYSMDENRVTAALLHIIRLCGIKLVKDLNIDKQPHTIFKLGHCVPISIRHSEPNAFARKQRYTTIDKLITAKDTSELK